MSTKKINKIEIVFNSTSISDSELRRLIKTRGKQRAGKRQRMVGEAIERIFNSTKEYTIQYVMKVTGKGYSTIREWIKKGDLPAHKDDEGNYQIKEKDIDLLLRRNIITAIKNIEPRDLFIAWTQAVSRGRKTKGDEDNVFKSVSYSPLEKHLPEIIKPIDNPKFISISETAKRLEKTGRTIYRLIDEGYFRKYKMVGSVFIEEIQVDNYGLTVKEASKFLKCSEKTIYRKIDEAQHKGNGTKKIMYLKIKEKRIFPLKYKNKWQLFLLPIKKRPLK